MTDSGLPDRRGAALLAGAMGVLIVVGALVAIAAWRVPGDRAVPAISGTPRAQPTTATAKETPEEDAAEQALAAYNGFREAYITAAATADYEYPGLAAHAVDPALAEARFALYLLDNDGLVYTGRPSWSARVTSIDLTTTPMTAHLEACVDISSWHVVRAVDGTRAGAPGQPTRYVVTAQAILGDNERWLIREFASDRSASC